MYGTRYKSCGGMKIKITAVCVRRPARVTTFVHVRVAYTPETLPQTEVPLSMYRFGAGNRVGQRSET